MADHANMNQERERAGTDLSALRIQREPEKSGGTRGWLLFAAIAVVAAGAAAYFLAGKSLRPKKVDLVTASIVTDGQATTLLTATGYIEAERKADLSPKITSRITELNVTEGSRVRKGDVVAGSITRTSTRNWPKPARPGSTRGRSSPGRGP